MKKFYGVYLVLLTIAILIITGQTSAFFIDDGKSFYGGDKKPGIKANDNLVKASTTFRDREAVPEGLTKTEWGKIRAVIERDQYRLHTGKHKNIYQATNHAQNMSFTFTPEGLEVRLKKQNTAKTWGLRLKRYGYGDKLHDVSAVEDFVVKENRIDYHRGDLVEWYINDYRGLEQGFTLQQKPSESKGVIPLELHLMSMSDFVPEVNKDGKGITWKNEHGETELHYKGLVAYDAAGKVLEASMKVDQGEIRLTIEDQEAVYPITIDPFIQSAKLTAFGGGLGDNFGNSVSISGDTAIVGAPQAFFQIGGRKGAAYIFYRNHGRTNNWGEVKKLIANDGAADDNFGCSVSISGDTAIVGAYDDDDKGDGSGSAYIFSRNEGGTDNWGEEKKLTAYDGAVGDNFGESVSISGSTAIVGAYADDDYSGSAYIFRSYVVIGEGKIWQLVKKLTASDGAPDQSFGDSVSISGDTAIAGASDAFFQIGGRKGAAYIFYRNHGGTNNWGEVKKLIASDGAADDDFGHSVSISGDTVIVGASLDDDKGPSSGSAYIFSRNEGGTDNWGEVQKLTAYDGAASDRFGLSVSISGDTVIVGASLDDDKGPSSGSAYIFSRNEGGMDNWGEVQKLTAYDGAASDRFGLSVSISGDTAIAGASGDNDYSGSAYIFYYECPFCSGDNVILTNVTFSSDRTCECLATTSITIGSGVTIPNKATVTFT